jgi:hypothetical protein
MAPLTVRVWGGGGFVLSTVLDGASLPPHATNAALHPINEAKKALLAVRIRIPLLTSPHTVHEGVPRSMPWGREVELEGAKIAGRK